MHRKTDGDDDDRNRDGDRDRDRDRDSDNETQGVEDIDLKKKINSKTLFAPCERTYKIIKS